MTLASPEVKFVLDSESLNPTDVQAYALLEANALVEEFMLLANITVSKKILRHYPTLSVLRRHPSPNRAMFEGLISKAKCRGFEIDIENSVHCGYPGCCSYRSPLRLTSVRRIARFLRKRSYRSRSCALLRIIPMNLTIICSVEIIDGKVLYKT